MARKREADSFLFAPLKNCDMEIIRNAKGFYELHIGNHVYNLSSLIEELIDANKEYDIEATFLRMMDAFIFYIVRYEEPHYAEVFSATSENYWVIYNIIKGNRLDTKL